jgi:hypothetical protein
MKDEQRTDPAADQRSSAPADPRLVTLAGLASGAVEELWQAALAQVLENIDDPNTDADTKRKIALTFDIEPEESRKSAKITFRCAVKTAGVRAVGTSVFIGRHEGRLAAVEALAQEELFPRPAAKPALVSGGGK